MDETNTGRKRSRWRIAFLVLPYVAAIIVAFVVAEYFVRNREQKIHLSDRVDAELIRYESTLGWTLTPNWSGNHENHDFLAHYKVNYLGFRADSPPPVAHHGTFVAVLGDSFTFGFGVDDDRTFVHHLNQEFGFRAAFVNCGTPGYSTDQEALLLEKTVLGFRPDVVLVCVYLGNDLIDCPRPFPIQANLGKPYFSIEDGELHLNNVPVPQVPKGPTDPLRELHVAVLGEQTEQPGILDKLVSRSVLFTLFRDRYVPAPDYSQAFSSRFADELDLFYQIVLRMRRDCEVQGSSLCLALLAGRSFVETPGSLSAQYQDFFREAILGWAGGAQIPVIDVAGQMRGDLGDNKKNWFFPNDGHFSPEGHERVAGLLAAELQHSELIVSIE